MTTVGLLQYSHTIGTFGLEGKAFINPVDAAFGSKSRIYVLNRAGPDYLRYMPSKRVVMCTVGEDFLGEFSTGGTGDGQLMWPSGIACDEDGKVYISDDALHRITIFNQDGKFLSKWGSQGSGQGQIDRPAGIAFDKDQNLLVVDSMNNRVQKFTQEGRFIDGWGKAGKGAGEFNLPWAITVDHSGNVFVADWRNDRIQKFDPQGKHLATFGSSGQGDAQFHRPSGVAVDRDGDIYVADWGNERMQMLRPDGSFRAKLRGQATMSTWTGDYFTANPNEWEERQKSNLEPPLELEPEHYLRNESASIEKLFFGPIAVKVDGQGRVYVVESCRHRIQVYQKGRG